MQHVSLEEAKTQLPDLINAAMNGDEVFITNNGQVVRLVPVEQSKRRQAGSAKGLIVYMSDDFDAPLEDFKEYME